jgi:hypothetical protein
MQFRRYHCIKSISTFFHDFNSTFEASSRAETTIASLAKIPVGRTTPFCAQPKVMTHSRMIIFSFLMYLYYLIVIE